MLHGCRFKIFFFFGITSHFVIKSLLTFSINLLGNCTWALLLYRSLNQKPRSQKLFYCAHFVFFLITYCIKGLFCVLQAAIVICQCDELRVRFKYRFKTTLQWITADDAIIMCQGLVNSDHSSRSINKETISMLVF